MLQLRMHKSLLQILAFSVGLFACVQMGYAAVSNVTVAPATASRVVSTTTTSGTGTTATTTTAITIYGGYAGPYGECVSGTTTSTCNSCTALQSLGSLTYYSCSTTSINTNLELSLSMQFDSIPAGTSFYAKSGTTTVPIIFSSPLVANTPLTVRIRWADICTAGGAAACVGTGNSANFSLVIEVGLSANASDFTSGFSQTFNVKYNYKDASVGNGTLLACSATVPFCQFQVIPGDEKVYVQDIIRGNLGPDGNSSVKWKALRVYYSENTGNFAIPLGSTARYADFDILDQSTVISNLSNNKITGLTNEQEYMFTIATVDDATVVQAILDSTTLAGDPTRYVAKPGKVVGLLNNKKCFIATAAFGSPMAPQVVALRKFRDQFLLTNTWGRKFVETYYQYSPPVAEFISQHEFLRTAVRIALWPMVTTVNWVMNE